MTSHGLVANFFRHEYSHLVAVLCRRAGVDHIEAIEDAVQSALLKALEHWTASGQPDNPSAWLFRVASNNLAGTLRQQTNRSRNLQTVAHEPVDRVDDALADQLRDDVNDDMLRMLFLCCDDAIPAESQLIFALRNLCGFSIREIALRLFATEANVYKRLARARTRLRDNPPLLIEPDSKQLSERLPAVHRILYVLFTEGYLSSHSELAIRRELSDEAIRLGTLLTGHRRGQAPETFALLALMHLHSARLDARQNDAGGLLLLQEQDRSLWDQQRIGVGLSWLARSAVGDVFSRYHAEAGIAAEHCLASTFNDTDWKKVAQCYAILERVASSPVHTLNRAIAVAEIEGPQAALDMVNAIAPLKGLADSFVWAVTLADLHRRCGNQIETTEYTEKALARAPSEAAKALFQRRIGPATEPP